MMTLKDEPKDVSAADLAPTMTTGETDAERLARLATGLRDFYPDGSPLDCLLERLADEIVADGLSAKTREDVAAALKELPDEATAARILREIAAN